ncbi:MAG: hypothetical protein J6Y57_02185 [Lachnospiraceae bacterium]|nr:hypothetical protein [Lachnospiraceae bacterium]
MHIRKILPALLIPAVLFCTGCTRGADENILIPDNEDEYVTGGITDRTNHDAPKEIHSDEITGFFADFFLSWRWMGEDDHKFTFSIEKDADGKLIASEKNTGINYPADEELLKALQNVIRTYELPKKNGISKTTAGLPPEFQPSTFKVDYASGERLYFREDNDPDAEWAEDIYTLFADWFADKGIDTLRPAAPTAAVTRFNLHYMEEGVEYDFSSGMEGDEKYAALPDDLFKKLTEILYAYEVIQKYDFSIYNHDSRLLDNHEVGFYGMSGEKPDYNEPDLEDSFLDLYAEFDDGSRINIETKKASELNAMKPMIDEMISVCGE